MVQWVTGQVVENKHWGGQLHSLRVDAEIAPFAAGQFIKLGLEIGGEIVSRPYSLVNAPQQRPLDIYFIVVPDGLFTAKLGALQAGQEVLVAPRAAGFLVLSEVPQARHLWLISTGTGIGPFLSMLRTEDIWQRFERVVLVHAVRKAEELSYPDAIQGVSAAHPQQFSFIPFISREASALALPGRVPQAIVDGRLEVRAGIRFDAADSQIMLCGNPAMVKDTTDALVARGLKKNKRSDPGQISVENYW